MKNPKFWKCLEVYISRFSSLGHQHPFPDRPHQNESWTEVKRCSYWAVSELHPSQFLPKVTGEIAFFLTWSVSGEVKLVPAPFRYSLHISHSYFNIIHWLGWSKNCVFDNALIWMKKFEINFNFVVIFTGIIVHQSWCNESLTLCLAEQDDTAKVVNFRANNWSQVVILDSRWHYHVCPYSLCRCSFLLRPRSKNTYACLSLYPILSWPWL